MAAWLVSAGFCVQKRDALSDDCLDLPWVQLFAAVVAKQCTSDAAIPLWDWSRRATAGWSSGSAGAGTLLRKAAVALFANGVPTGLKQGLQTGAVLQNGANARLEVVWLSGKFCVLGTCPAVGKRLRRTTEVETPLENTAMFWCNRGRIVKQKAANRLLERARVR